MNEQRYIKNLELELDSFRKLHKDNIQYQEAQQIRIRNLLVRIDEIKEDNKRLLKESVSEVLNHEN